MQKLTSIQVLRAVAALAVTVAHTSGWVANATAQAGISNPVPGMVTGAAGVDLFFVISGFIMVYTTRNDFGSPSDAWRFLSRRLIRIVPLYWLMTFILIGYVLAVGHTLAMDAIDARAVMTSLFFVFDKRTPYPNGEITSEPILGQGWSLNYEMFFYVLFAAAMLFPRRRSLPILLALLIGLGGWHRFLPFDFPFAIASVLNPFLWEFAAGVIIGLAFAADWRLPSRVAEGLILAGVILFAARMAWPELLPAERALHWGFPCALLLAGCVFLDYDWRGWGIAALIGDSSYALYLTHGLTMMVPPFLIWQGLPVWMVSHIGPWGYVAYLTGASVAVGALVYLVIERPMTEILRRLTRRKPVLIAIPAQ